MPTNANNPLEQLFSGLRSQSDVKDVNKFEKKERTLVIGDSIYPLANVSVIEVADLLSPIPLIVWLVLVGGIVFFLADSTRPLGFIMIAFFGIVAFFHWREAQTSRYGLRIVTNSGTSLTLLSGNVAFLRKVRDDLNDRINSQDTSPTIYDMRGAKIQSMRDVFAPATIGDSNTIDNQTTVTKGQE